MMVKAPNLVRLIVLLTTTTLESDVQTLAQGLQNSQRISQDDADGDEKDLVIGMYSTRLPLK
jgi:hypothetical protein